MNQARRKQIEQAKAAFADAIQKATASAIEQLETIRDDEQEYFDVMPEGIQMGGRGEKAQAAIDQLDEALTLLEGIDDTLSDFETYLEGAAE